MKKFIRSLINNNYKEFKMTDRYIEKKYSIECKGRNSKGEETLVDPVPVEVKVYKIPDSNRILSLVKCPYNTGSHGQRCNASHPELDKDGEGVNCPYSFDIPSDLEKKKNEKNLEEVLANNAEEISGNISDEEINYREFFEFFGTYTKKQNLSAIWKFFEKDQIKTFGELSKLELRKNKGIRNIINCRGVGEITIQIVYSYFHSKGFELFKGGYYEKELNRYYKKELKGKD